MTIFVALARSICRTPQGSEGLHPGSDTLQPTSDGRTGVGSTIGDHVPRGNPASPAVVIQRASKRWPGHTQTYILVGA